MGAPCPPRRGKHDCAPRAARRGARDDDHPLLDVKSDGLICPLHHLAEPAIASGVVFTVATVLIALGRRPDDLSVGRGSSPSPLTLGVFVEFPSVVGLWHTQILLHNRPLQGRNIRHLLSVCSYLLHVCPLPADHLRAYRKTECLVPFPTRRYRFSSHLAKWKLKCRGGWLPPARNRPTPVGQQSLPTPATN